MESSQNSANPEHLMVPPPIPRQLYSNSGSVEQQPIFTLLPTAYNFGDPRPSLPMLTWNTQPPQIGFGPEVPTSDPLLLVANVISDGRSLTPNQASALPPGHESELAEMDFRRKAHPLQLPRQPHQPEILDIQDMFDGSHTAVEKPRRSGPRVSALKLPDWEKHRDQIKKLYIDESKSLQETRNIMSAEFGFTSSTKLYKEKLEEWGLAKNLPNSTANWVLEKEKRRRQEGKKTIFEFGGRPLNIAEAQRKAKRVKAQSDGNSVIDLKTPQHLVYRTPRSDIAPSPQNTALSPHNIMSTEAKLRHEARWTPPPKSGSFPQDLPRLTWKGRTTADLDIMYQDAESLSNLEEFEEAEAKFREALVGHEYLLSSTHENTIILAFRLANFYARRGRMNDADAVLDWLGKEHIRFYGVGDERTVAHVLRVVEFFHKWSRPEDAIILLNRTLITSQKQLPAVGIIANSNSKVQIASQPGSNSRIPAVFNAQFVSSGGSCISRQEELSKVDYKLSLAKAHAEASNKEAETHILRLIEECDKFPDKLAVHSFDARCTLVELYQKLGDSDKIKPALDNAQVVFRETLQRESEKGLLLKIAVKLADLFISANLSSEAKSLLNTIENEVADIFEEYDGNYIDTLIDLGSLYQKHIGWAEAERHFEHALAISMSIHELGCRVVRTLEAALENEHFVRQLPASENRKLSFRSHGFKRCGCGGIMGEFGSRY